MAKKEEKFEVRGEDVVKKVKELIKEGNIRSITISDKQGKVIESGKIVCSPSMERL